MSAAAHQLGHLHTAATAQGLSHYVSVVSRRRWGSRQPSRTFSIMTHCLRTRGPSRSLRYTTNRIMFGCLPPLSGNTALDFATSRLRPMGSSTGSPVLTLIGQEEAFVPRLKWNGHLGNVACPYDGHAASDVTDTPVVVNY